MHLWDDFVSKVRFLPNPGSKECPPILSEMHLWFWTEYLWWLLVSFPASSEWKFLSLEPACRKWNPRFLLPNCVNMNNSLSLFEPCFSHLSNWEKIMVLVLLNLVRIKITHMKCLSLYLEGKKHSITITYYFSMKQTLKQSSVKTQISHATVLMSLLGPMGSNALQRNGICIGRMESKTA